MNLSAAFKSVTMDIVSEMVFGEEFGVIDSPGFQHPHLDALHDAVKKAWIFRAFPKLGWMSLNMPDWISSNIFPVPIIEFAKVRAHWRRRNVRTDSNKVCRARIDKYLQDRADPDNKVFSEVLEQLLDPKSAKGHVVPSSSDLNEEALTLLTAGNDTTANSMILGAYMICSHPDVKSRLAKELCETFPNIHGSVTYEKAKELPYLVRDASPA